MDLVHPDHASGPGGYTVDPGWLGRFVAHQAEARVAVRAQIHTHPGRAFHSATDDDWPMVGTAGFVSIVVPNFAITPPTIADLYACRLEADGSWHELNPGDLFSG